MKILRQYRFSIGFFFKLMLSSLMMLCSFEAKSQTHFIWEVKKGTQTFWLMGLSHTLLPKNAKIPLALENIYQKSTVIVPESVLFTGQVLPRVMPVGSVKPSVHSIQLVEKLVANKLMSELHGQLMLEIPVEETQQYVDSIMDFVRPRDVIPLVLVEGFDAQLTKRAYQENKPVDVLEKRWRAREVWRKFCGLEKNRDEILNSIASALRKPPNFEDLNIRILDADFHGDLKALENIERDWALSAPYSKLLRRCSIVPRTKEWVSYIPELLKRHTAPLFLVGSSHVIGTEGMVEMLRKRGYQLSRVYP